MLPTPIYRLFPYVLALFGLYVAWNGPNNMGRTCGALLFAVCLFILYLRKKYRNEIEPERGRSINRR